ncbi:Hypothetical predicted protein, partial [Xyrichtys novacula]
MERLGLKESKHTSLPPPPPPPPPPPHYYILPQPRQIPSALLTAPTQPFSGLCHLIHAEDDSRSAIWGHAVNNLRYQSSIKHPSGTLRRAAQ